MKEGGGSIKINIPYYLIDLRVNAIILGKNINCWHQESGRRLKRTIHLSFVPDEEIGGLDGMKVFVHTKEFKAGVYNFLNIHMFFTMEQKDVC